MAIVFYSIVSAWPKNGVFGQALTTGVYSDYNKSNDEGGWNTMTQWTVDLFQISYYWGNNKLFYEDC